MNSEPIAAQGPVDGTVRARFEAWRESVPGGQFGLSRCTEPGYTHEYGDPFTQQQLVAWQAAEAAERAYWKNAMAMMLVARSGQITDMDLAERLAKVVADERSNAQVTGRASGPVD